MAPGENESRLIGPLRKGNTMLTETLDFTTDDVAYLSHGEAPLMLRLYRPIGSGPFPLVVDLHGGAWNSGDLTGCQARDEVLVQSGFSVAALDFRHGGDGYPTSLIDINYAIRWLKAEARTLRLDPARVGGPSATRAPLGRCVRPPKPRSARLWA